VRVAFFVPGSFTHILSKQVYGADVAWVEVASANEVVRAIEHGRADLGLVPYYNSYATTEGIPLDYGLLGQSTRVYVDYILDRPIRLCLAAEGPELIYN
jgi:prephenate dehydratase